jgi:hypothetical protein
MFIILYISLYSNPYYIAISNKIQIAEKIVLHVKNNCIMIKYKSLFNI